MSKVVLRGYILVPTADLDAVKQALPTHQRLTQAEAGCLVFDVKQCAGHPLRFDVYEAFIDSDSFDAHQARAAGSDWANVSANTERHYEIFRCE